MNIFHNNKLFRCSCQTIALLALIFLFPIGSALGANNQGTSSAGNQKRPNKGIPMNPGESAGDDTDTSGGSKNKTGGNSTKRLRIQKINLVSMPNMRWVKGKRPRFIEKKIRKFEVYGP